MRTSFASCPPVQVDETRSGTPGIVDLWHWNYRADEAALGRAAGALMSDDERERGARLRFRRDRCVHLAARILVRSLLSRYAPGVAPAEWRFQAGERGKPRVAGPASTPPLHFNLAHTPGVVAMALSVAHDEVGVDVERPERPIDAVDLAQRFFAPEEAAAVRNAPPGEAGPRFVVLWTLKESYLKARGQGLALPLDAVHFNTDGECVRARFDAALADDAADWRFASVEAPESWMAVAARTGGAALALRTSAFAAPPELQA